MKKRKSIIYEVVALLAAAGVIVSYLLAPDIPSSVAPQPTIYTALCGAVLLGAEYLWARETARLNGQKITVKWNLLTLAFLAVSAVPQAFCLTLAAYFWFAVLPLFVALIALRLFRLGRLRT